jgi:glutamate-1-semialdehyde 2,1-aminomutase
VMSWGPLIGGHQFAPVVRALRRQLRKGEAYGTLSEQEIEYAAFLKQMWPGIEKLRMVNSGTEATMSAIRLARGYTRRNKIVKFDGCYHGHADYLLVKGGSGLATYGLSSSAGVSDLAVRDTLVAPYNNGEAVRRLFEQNPDNIAAVIVEPVVGNMGVILPRDGFLAELRKLCSQYGALFICDEVMTGFRLSLNGAQGVYRVTPDLICLGKILGGGLPCGAYGGRADIMNQVSPEGAVYQAGTLAGNPLTMAAGLAMVKYLARNHKRFYAELDCKTSVLKSESESFARQKGVPLLVQKAGSMFTFFFTEKAEVIDFEEAKATQTRYFAPFFMTLLKNGVYFPPSPFEAAFMSSAHGDREMHWTLRAIKRALTELTAHTG